MVCLAPLAAFAADGTIDINGTIVNTTCTINVDGSGANAATVRLPAVSSSSLRQSGDVAGATPFNIQTVCLQPLSLTAASIYWEPNGALVDMTTGNLLNLAPGGSANVQIQLLASGTPLALNRGPGQQNNPVATGLTPGHYYLITWPYAARYYATGQATPGAVSGYATFTVVYS
jgi:major type 1 subunit fimbrin (pilin)